MGVRNNLQTAEWLIYTYIYIYIYQYAKRSPHMPHKLRFASGLWTLLTILPLAIDSFKKDNKTTYSFQQMEGTVCVCVSQTC